MNESFSSPKPYCPEKYLACPPKPREGKPSVSFDDKNFIVMPLFFPSRRHTLGTNDSTDSEVNGDPAKINMPAAEFNRKNRPYNSEAPSRKISIENFPTLPFSCSAPTNQAPSSHPLPVKNAEVKFRLQQASAISKTHRQQSATMDESFSSPKFYHSEKCLACPPTPRGRKPSVTFDDKNSIVIPIFFPSSCSIISTNDPTANEVNGDPAKINMPAADFTLKSRPYNSEAPTRKISIEDFPTLPFSLPAPTNQAPSSHPLPVRMPGSSSDSNKLPPFERRGSSGAHAERRHTTFNATCA
eukprot:CAMPEP_0202029612 /NCGR_PEP_ID=MMETSP0905-20130828/64070_1 /ASSEMBLY_ACC=CAM_ASM_000554 /TAXON_ID=420261 /ORGANISM="Thalassiosira antarctica, Strain CCMP982" /LENGTH=298 /DNA_ID=CAMNT_0048593383 /DNA_START=74 /DNA_END=969 /DNA_ORIENTATION=+